MQVKTESLNKTIVNIIRETTNSLIGERKDQRSKEDLPEAIPIMIKEIEKMKKIYKKSEENEIELNLIL